MSRAGAAITVEVYPQVRDKPRIDAAMEAILFEANADRAFAGEGAREAFRHRYLDRYLYRHQDELLIALAPEGHAVGYLAGCTIPILEVPAFGDLGYLATFADLVRPFPAHLHLVVATGERESDAADALIAAFSDSCRRQNVRGAHAVLEAGARPFACLGRHGFHEVATRPHGDRQMVLLGQIF